MLNSSVDLTSKSDSREADLLILAHKLAHSLRNENHEEFLNIYDKIPSRLDQSNLDSIKETARLLSELSVDEFKFDCLKLECNYEMTEQSSSATSSTTTTSTTSTSTTTKLTDSAGDIVRNEAFFSEKTNLTNPVYNPLLLTSSNKFHNVTPSASASSHDPNRITISNTQLYKDNFSDETKLAQSEAKCRFVTNQLYQNKKDSQHNECMLTSCFDEVLPANQTDNESDSDNSYYDDDENTTTNNLTLTNTNKKESVCTSSSSSTNSSMTSNSPATEQQSVIIDIEDDDEDDEEEYDSSKNREKFESLVQSKEKLKALEFNDADMNEIIASEPTYLLAENKYDKDDQLLKSYKDECKYGFVVSDSQHRERAKQILNKTTTQQSTDQAISSDKRCSASMRQSMKSDFNKNEDDDDEECEYDETISNCCHDNGNYASSNKNIKTLLNNKKPPPPPTTTTTTTVGSSSSLYSYKQDDSSELLDNLVSFLHNKTKLVSSSSKSSPYSSSLQFNNYKNEVDLNSNFGLSYGDAATTTSNEHTTTKTSSTLNTSDVVLNFDDLNNNKKSSISSSSSSTSSSSSSTSSSGAAASNRPSNINRRSAEAYMDSHGSSLTNSSKQEEDDDLDDEETSANSNVNHASNLSDNEMNEFSLLNKTTSFKSQASNYGSIKVSLILKLKLFKTS